jgi:hypothetical protein
MLLLGALALGTNERHPSMPDLSMHTSRGALAPLRGLDHGDEGLYSLLGNGRHRGPRGVVVAPHAAPDAGSGHRSNDGISLPRMLRGGPRAPRFSARLSPMSWTWVLFSALVGIGWAVLLLGPL